jgi:hypothetical protein
MHRHLVSIALGATLWLLASAGGAATLVETFDGGNNTGGWTFGASEVIAPAGGNPGAFLHVTGLDTFAPQLFFIFQMWELGLDNPTVVGDTVPVELLRLSVE